MISCIEGLLSEEEEEEDTGKALSAFSNFSGCAISSALFTIACFGILAAYFKFLAAIPATDCFVLLLLRFFNTSTIKLACKPFVAAIGMSFPFPGSWLECFAAIARASGVR